MDYQKAFKVKSNISVKRYGYGLNKSHFQQVYDFLLFPLRCVLPYGWVQRLNLTDLGRERRAVVIPHLQGKILDIGCGPLGELKNEYKIGSNILSTDIFQWKSVDLSCSAETLPFKENSFDTVLMLACLNHFNNKESAVMEACRVLKPGGKILITMINQTLGDLVHRAAFWFDYDHYRQRGRFETSGLSRDFIIETLEKNNFKKIKVTSFLYGLNHLFIGEK